MSDRDRASAGVLDGSAVVSTLRAARDGSTLLRTGSVLGDRLAAGSDRSRVFTSVGGAGDRLARWSRHSWLFGPPAEPEVVVVDLRETYTVGPLLAVLDRTVAWAAPRWRGSAPARTLDRAGDAVADAPVRTLSWVLLGVLLGPVALAAAAGRAPSGWLLVAVGVALLGTRERRSTTALRASPAGRVLAALLVPPDHGTGSYADGATDDGATHDGSSDPSSSDGKFDEE